MVVRNGNGKRMIQDGMPWRDENAKVYARVAEYDDENMDERMGCRMGQIGRI